MSDDFRLTKEEFDSIYAKVPRLTVELVLRKEGELFLTKRTIEPCKGQWHLPGGTVYFGESLFDTVRRIAKRELGIVVTKAQQKDIIEYPSHYLNGLDCPVGVVFIIEDYSGDFAISAEADDYGWFKTAPQPIHADQSDYLIKNQLIITG